MTKKELCERYPFLIPRLYSTDEIVPDFDPEDPVYTRLDDMPPGWHMAFGVEMCEDIRDALLYEGGDELLDSYRIGQIKEKYGELRWYSSPHLKIIDEIIDYYTEVSSRTCARCGVAAQKINLHGWLIPLCDSCAEIMGGKSR